MQQYSMKAPAKSPVEVAVNGFAMCKLWVYSQTILNYPAAPSVTHTPAGCIHTHSLHLSVCLTNTYTLHSVDEGRCKSPL